MSHHLVTKQHIEAVKIQSLSSKSAASNSVQSSTSATQAQLSSIEVFPPVQTGPSTSQLPVSKALQDIYMEEDSYFYPDGTKIQFSAGESPENTLQQNLALQLQHLHRELFDLF
jgi:hypothetical protein